MIWELAKLQKNTKTHTRITYDSKGDVIRGSDATTDDIAESPTRKYVTDAQLTALENISGINTGDNAVNSRYESLVSNATHSGDALGSTALTVVGINGTVLSTLGTGLLKISSGIPSIAIAADFPILNQNTTGTAANGIPVGGTAGQVLAKIDGSNYNTHWISASGSGDALTSNPLSQFAPTTKAQLNSVISDGTPMYVGDPPTSHTHTISDITDFGTYSTDIHANITALNAVSGVNTGDQDLSGLLVKSNNLSDLTNITTARTNLGLGSLATQSGTFSGISSGTNTGDQTSIVGITGTKAEFNTAVTDGDILFTNDITGTPDGTKFLRDDYSWQTISGGSSGNIDGGSSSSIYGGTAPIDGGLSNSF